MSAVKYFALFVAAMCLANVYAVSDDEKSKIKDALRPAIGECGGEFGITKETLLDAKAKGDYSNIDSCFFACVFKKSAFMTAEGVFDKDTALEKVKKYVSDADDITKATEIANACTKVNDETVSDGAKGCERARSLAKCFHGYKHLL